jgi:glutamate--cysteine ligase
VPRLALGAQVAGRPVRDVARDMVAIAAQGLRSRGRLSGGLVDESSYLGELEDIADTGVTAAERLLALYNGPWQGDASEVFEAFAY